MLAEVIGKFRDKYTKALVRVHERGIPVGVCTIYDAIPTLEEAARAALTGFNAM